MHDIVKMVGDYAKRLKEANEKAEGEKPSKEEQKRQFDAFREELGNYIDKNVGVMQDLKFNEETNMLYWEEKKLAPPEVIKSELF